MRTGARSSRQGHGIKPLNNLHCQRKMRSWVHFEGAEKGVQAPGLKVCCGRGLGVLGGGGFCVSELIPVLVEGGQSQGGGRDLNFEDQLKRLPQGLNCRDFVGQAPGLESLDPPMWCQDSDHCVPPQTRITGPTSSACSPGWIQCLVKLGGDSLQIRKKTITEERSQGTNTNKVIFPGSGEGPGPLDPQQYPGPQEVPWSPRPPGSGPVSHINNGNRAGGPHKQHACPDLQLTFILTDHKICSNWTFYHMFHLKFILTRHCAPGCVHSTGACVHVGMRVAFPGNSMDDARPFW